MESMVRYLGIEVEDALEMAEQTEVWNILQVFKRSTNRHLPAIYNIQYQSYP